MLLEIAFMPELPPCASTTQATSANLHITENKADVGIS